MGRLSGQTAVVTGGAMGLGEAIVHAFAREGASVAIADLDEGAGPAVAAAVQAAGGEALFARTDVRREDDVAAAVAAATDRWGRLDVMVNNAGIAIAGRDELLAMDCALWDDIMAVNLRSVFFGMKHAVPVMIDQGGGKIISTASIGALPGLAGGLAYDATKAAIVKMTMVVAARYAQHNIRANAIAPGMIVTPLSTRHLGHLSPEERESNFASRQPLGRGGRAQDIADAAVFLASDESSFVTGQTLVVDGGLIMAGWGARMETYTGQHQREAVQ
jgi:NAD(P)-dependent dehydrogenase (short-subunit alcohol dehydrogenase family)